MPSSPPSLPQKAHQPRGERALTLLLTGKLTLGAPQSGDSWAGEALCRVRNISAGGLMAEVRVPVPVGAALAVQLHGAAPMHGQVRWSDQQRFGLQFDEAVDVSAMLQQARASTRDDMLIPLPQFAVDCPAELHVYGRIFRIHILRLAQGGAILQSDIAPKMGQIVKLSVEDGLLEAEGVLVQQGGGIASMNFTQALAFHDLAQYLGQRLWPQFSAITA